MTSGSQRCPDGSDLGRVEVGDPGGCRPKICREDFNRSVAIPVRVRDDNIVNGDDEVTVHFKVADDSGLWDHVKIPGQKLRIIPSKTTQSCAVTPSDPGKVIRTFDSREFGLSQPGIYTLYRHRALPVEVQAHFRYRDTDFRYTQFPL